MCDGDHCFTVGALPSRWRQVQQEGLEIGFFDDLANAAIQGNSTCRDDVDLAPLSSLTSQLLLGYTARTIRSESLVPLDRREALHTIVDARLDGVPIVLDLYVTKRDNCIYDLSLAAPPLSYARAQADFTSFVTGFAGGRAL